MKVKSILNPFKLTKAIYIEILSLIILIKYGFPDYLLQIGGGIGDELLLTAVAREIKRRKPDAKIWQVSHSKELFLNNPDYYKVFDMTKWYLRYSFFLKSRRKKLFYAKEIIPKKSEVPPSKHIIAELCSKAGLKGQVAIKPYFYFSNKEKSNINVSSKRIAIQCISKNSYETVMKNKLWSTLKFLKLINLLRDKLPEIEIVQIGSSKDYLLPHVKDLRGKTTLRETASILANSHCFIGTVGLLMHMARAVECSSVIIYGGREHSNQTGYICNANINSYINCAPCWLWNDCDNGRKCMEMITPEAVYALVEQLLEKSNTNTIQVVEI